MNPNTNTTPSSAVVRKFRAADPRAALEAVKAALGDEAIILATREVSGGLFGRREIEITAARSASDVPEPPAPSKEALESEVASLRRVVGELRKELKAPRAEPRDVTQQVPPEAVRVCRALMRRGIEATIAEELVRQALKEAPSVRETDLFEAVRLHVRRRLSAVTPPWEKGPRRIVALVGPTGVGKTTTIAKVAARALLESRLKVCLVTVDTYRIGASEHIGRYGEIMGVPTYVARDAATLRDALARCASAELVLVDTAGRSDPDALAAQADLLRAVPGMELHLALSAAVGSREIVAAARRYRGFDVSKLIFSKLDEADGPGSVLSAVAAVGRPVSCVTDGQRVPDDLHAGNAPRFVDLVVGP